MREEMPTKKNEKKTLKRAVLPQYFDYDGKPYDSCQTELGAFGTFGPCAEVEGKALPE